MDTFLDFSFHELDNAFRKVSVEAYSLGAEIVVGGSLDVLMSVEDVFLFDENFVDFKQ